MWWQSSRLDRIEQNMERMQKNMGQMQQSIRELAEISNATNRRIDRFVEEMREGNKEQRARTEQLQQTMEYLLSRDG
jgi:DNA anti-recombination protein RmuC